MQNRPLSILYIDRIRPATKLKWWVARKLKGLTDGQEGFFEASLYMSGNITRLTLNEFLLGSKHDLNSFDALVVNQRSGLDWTDDNRAFWDKFRTFNGSKALFQHNAHPRAMPPNEVVDCFNVIFKREPYADLDRYQLSYVNRKKLVATHLSNPFQRHSINLPRRNKQTSPRMFAWQMPPKYDVGFLGSVLNGKFSERMEVWQRVVASDINHFGGLFSGDKNIPPELVGEKMGRPSYMKKLSQTAINLALAGHGPFTYRHVELMWAGAFVLSTPEVKEQRLRAPLVEGRDYVAFENADDAIDKIRYFLANPEERRRIARNGRAAFEQFYDCAAHSKEIATALRDGPTAVQPVISIANADHLPPA